MDVPGYDDTKLEISPEYLRALMESNLVANQDNDINSLDAVLIFESLFSDVVRL